MHAHACKHTKRTTCTGTLGYTHSHTHAHAHARNNISVAKSYDGAGDDSGAGNSSGRSGRRRGSTSRSPSTKAAAARRPPFGRSPVQFKQDANESRIGPALRKSVTRRSGENQNAKSPIDKRRNDLAGSEEADEYRELAMYAARRRVEEWLETIGMQRYSKTFRDNGLDALSSIEFLDDSDLASFKIPNEDRKVVLESIRSFSADTRARSLQALRLRHEQSHDHGRTRVAPSPTVPRAAAKNHPSISETSPSNAKVGSPRDPQHGSQDSPALAFVLAKLAHTESSPPTRPSFDVHKFKGLRLLDYA